MDTRVAALKGHVVEFPPDLSEEVGPRLGSLYVVLPSLSPQLLHEA